MLDITIIAVGRLRFRPWAEAADEYIKRLKPYARLKVIEVEASPFSPSSRDKSRQAEADSLGKALAKIAPGASVFMLEEGGEALDSPALARRLAQINQPLVFVIGGALGLEPSFSSRYPKLSLSSLTFTHEMARAILLEQLYRAATIIGGKTYHY